MGGTLVDVLLPTNMSKSSSILFLVVAASWLVCVQSQKVSFGACPTVTPMGNIDMSKYAKVWYERKKYCTIGQIGQRCIVATITDKGNDSYSLTNSAVTTLFNLPVTSEKEVTVGNGKNELIIASSMPEKVSVLDTDYTGYSIVWSCTDYGFINTQYLWFYSAERDSIFSDIFFHECRFKIWSGYNFVDRF